MATEPTPSPKAPAAALPPRPKRRRGFSFWFLLLALVIVSHWALKLYRENEDLRDPEAQARRIVAEVGAHILLPENEVPGVFPIDKSQATEPFFKNALNGDLLVVYRSTQQAFVYSPSRKILVNAGMLAVSPEQEQVPTGAAEEEVEPEPEEEVAAEEEI